MLACFTLTFDSSPIKGEGILLVVLDLFTLTLALSHQGRGDSVGCVVLFALTPVSGTGTGFGPLSSRERGFGGGCGQGYVRVCCWARRRFCASKKMSFHWVTMELNT